MVGYRIVNRRILLPPCGNDMCIRYLKGQRNVDTTPTRSKRYKVGKCSKDCCIPDRETRKVGKNLLCVTFDSSFELQLTAQPNAVIIKCGGKYYV